MRLMLLLCVHIGKGVTHVHLTTVPVECVLEAPYVGEGVTHVQVSLLMTCLAKLL